MIKVAAFVGALALLTGCASTQMKQYVGKDIREVILDSGPPINAVDLADGARGFQYPFGGGAFVTPTVTTTTASVSGYGNQAWLNAASITSGGQAVTLPPCVITYIARWDDSSRGWIVHEYRIPKQLFC